MKPDAKKKAAAKSKTQENPLHQLTTDGVGRVLLPGGDGVTGPTQSPKVGAASTTGTGEGRAGGMLKWLPTKNKLSPNDETKPTPVHMQRRKDSFAFRAPRMMEQK